MSPSNPEKLNYVVFAGEPDKWSDAKNAIELYLRSQNPPLIGYVVVDGYDGTQSVTLPDGTTLPPIHSPETPVVPPSTTCSSGGRGFDDDDEGSEDESCTSEKQKAEDEATAHNRRKKGRKLARNVMSLTAFTEMSRVALIIHQRMSQAIRVLVAGKKPFDQ